MSRWTKKKLPPVIGSCCRSSRQQEFMKFHNPLDEKFPERERETIYLVLDIYATHKTPQVKRWL